MSVKKLVRIKKNSSSLNWFELDKLVINTLLKTGWKIYNVDRTDSCFVNIIARKKYKIIGYFKIVYQVKNYSLKSVTINEIRQLERLILENKANKGLTTSLNKFTPHALKAIEKNKTNLNRIDVEEIIFMNCQFPQFDDLLF